MLIEKYYISPYKEFKIQRICSILLIYEIFCKNVLNKAKVIIPKLDATFNKAYAPSESIVSIDSWAHYNMP